MSTLAAVVFERDHGGLCLSVDSGKGVLAVVRRGSLAGHHTAVTLEKRTPPKQRRSWRPCRPHVHVRRANLTPRVAVAGTWDSNRPSDRLGAHNEKHARIWDLQTRSANSPHSVSHLDDNPGVVLGDP